MDRFDRIYALHGLLRDARRPVALESLQDKLECSRATLTRTIEDMRDFLGAPITYDRARQGYHYAPTGEHPYELPGLWFNAAELHGLLAAQQLLKDIQPGLLDADINPLRKRIEDILAKQRLGSGELPRRVRILKMAVRAVSEHGFQIVTGALVQRQRLHFQYHDRGFNRTTTREVSPQRLVHYRDNWYLDAWCHLRDDLRTFSLDHIQTPRALEQTATDIEDSRLDEHFTRTYGIFAGPVRHTAVLRFTPERARWVADERWHPEQQGTWLPDGRYELRLPYGDPRELIMDILKHGPEVEVMEPELLRHEVMERLQRMMQVYARDGARAVMGSQE